MKLTGRSGALRVYDSKEVLHGAAPLDDKTVDIVKYDGAAWSNITSDVETDDANVESAFIADDNDKIYVGSTDMFAMIKFLKGDGSNYAAASGALIAKYFDGTDFSNALDGVSDGTVSDGTASGGDCFAQDGVISFGIPKDWATGANTFNANLDADKYYVEIAATTSPTTDPDADVLCPVDGQYHEVIFANMDFSGPLGRPMTEEELVLNRGEVDSHAHYKEGADNKIHEPVEVGWSCLITATHRDRVKKALECGNPNADRWTATGESTKGDTKNDGTNANPAFADANKKTVNVQILFDAGSGFPIGLAYYECLFPLIEQGLAESPDAINLTCKGGCYGVIEIIYGFGNRY